jgi:hypothetical protein
MTGPDRGEEQLFPVVTRASGPPRRAQRAKAHSAYLFGFARKHLTYGDLQECFFELADDIEPGIKTDFRRAFGDLADAVVYNGLSLLAECAERLTDDLRLLADRALRHNVEIHWWFALGRAISIMHRLRDSDDQYDWADLLGRLRLLAEKHGEEVPQLDEIVRRVDCLVRDGRATRAVVYGLPEDTRSIGQAVHYRKLTPEAVALLDRLHEVIEGWLERNAGSQVMGPAFPSSSLAAESCPSPRLTVYRDPAQPSITLDGVRHIVSPDKAAFVQAVYDANGGWISGPEMRKAIPELEGARFDRILKKLPQPIASLIESGGPKGYRLKKDALA